jgi:peptidoglycan/LPS O-acetylase OafA/YrhL
VRKISNLQYAGLAIATYVVTVYGIRTIHTVYLPADNSYMVSFAYAFFVFVVGLMLEAAIRIPRFISFSSDVSYSLYLFHGVVGFLVLDILTPQVNLTIAIAAAFAVGMGTAYVSYRWIERPSQSAARWILRRTSRQQSKTPG